MLRLLGVRPEESGRVALLLLHYVWVVAVTIAGKSVRDTYFLTRYDRSLLPLMAVAAAVAVAISVALFTRAGRRLGSRVLVPLTCVVFACSLALLHFRIEGFVIPVLYVWMEVINVLTVLQFWLLAAELLDSRQAKRLFPIIGGGGSLAAILIGPQLKPFSKAYGSDTLLWLVCSLLLGAAAIAMATTRLPRVPAVRSEQKSRRSSWRSAKSPYLRMLGVIVICAAVVSAIVDYQFKIISSETLRTETDLVGFFGQFYAATGLSTLVLQFAVASYSFQRFGVVLVMAVLPFMLGLGSAAVLFWPVLSSAVLSRFSDQTFRFTLHNGGLELLWLPVSPDLRSEAKPFISGSLKSITEGAVGVVIYLLLHFLNAAQLSIVSLAFCGAWTGSLLRLRSLYVSELQSAIATRRLPPEDLEVSTTDALTVQVIDRALTRGDTAQTLFVLGLIANLPLTPWRATLRNLLERADPAVRARILQIASRDKSIVTNEMLTHMAAADGSEAVEAIRAIGTGGAAELSETVRLRLNDREPAIRAAACGALIRLNGTGSAGAGETLRSMLVSPETAVRIAALEESAQLDGTLDREILEAALSDPSRAVRAKALDAAAAHPDERHAPIIASSLSDPVLFSSARNALAALPPIVVLPVLTDRVEKKEPQNVRSASLRAMRVCLLPDTHSVLLNQVDAEWPALANQASQSLVTVARHVAPSPVTGATADTRRSDLVRAVNVLNQVQTGLSSYPNAVLLNDFVQTSISDLLPAIVRLAGLRHPESPIETTVHILQSRDRARLPFVLELLDTLLSASERQTLSPLLEQSDRQPAVGEVRSAPADSSSPAHIWLANSLYSASEWQRAIVLDYILRHYHPVLSEQIDWGRLPVTPLTCEVVDGCIGKQPSIAGVVPATHQGKAREEKTDMLTTLEKTILLKSVPLFTDIPGEELSRVAQIATERIFPADTTIFHDGDFGDCLYIIISGSVRIQKRGRELAVLGQGQSLGEMAVLDSSPRSADATTIDATLTLHVGQEQFLEIMQSNAGVMKGVVRMLLNRLRNMDDRLAGESQTASASRTS